jgi:parallel beta-helix repeat protein
MYLPQPLWIRVQMRKKTACLILFALVFVSTLSVAVRIPQVKAWNGTVHIYSDGSVDPPSAPIHQNVDVYTLTDNVITSGDGIIIERNSITFDGNGYTIQGGSSGNGVDLTGTIYVTVKNANLQGFSIGIFAHSSDYDTISGNTVGQNSVSGIWLDSSSNNDITGNNITQNGAYGIWLSSSSNNNIYHNNFVNNAVQVYTTYDSINIWDAGYPVAGNYWSDYAGSDLYGGLFQNVAGSDGIGDTPYVLDQNNVDHYPLIDPLIHDVGITEVSTSKIVVGQGYALNISVLIVNYGEQPEILNVTARASSTIIQTKNVTLAARASDTIIYVWNTSNFAKGNYTISAYAWPVPSETHTADNNFAGGWVLVTLVGDVNGDGKVDGKDLGSVAWCFGSYPGAPPPMSWDPNCDINNDGKVDGKDLGTVAWHFGEPHP